MNYYMVLFSRFQTIPKLFHLEDLLTGFEQNINSELVECWYYVTKKIEALKVLMEDDLEDFFSYNDIALNSKTLVPIRVAQW